MRRIHGIRTRSFLQRGIVPVAVLLFLLVGIGGCSRTSKPPMGQSPSKHIALSQLYWVLSQQDLTFIQSADPQIATRILNGPSTFVLTQSSSVQARPLPPGAIPTMLFTSYTAFMSSVQAKNIPADILAVEYDPEFWPATPQEEQQEPLRYMELFGQEAQRSGYQLILTPGRDLGLTPGGLCAKQQGETLNKAYLRCGITRAAQFAPVFEIQSAPVELNIQELRSFITASTRQAHAANPSAVLIATLSTTPDGVSANSADLVRAAKAILPFVRGFQLNMTSSTRTVVVKFLRAISGTGT
jgi:hypothetical protein